MKNRVRKRLSYLLSTAMLVGLFPQVSLATYQKPVKEITNVEITHQLDLTPGRNIIYPNISLEWTEAEKNDPDTKGASGDATMTPAYYSIDFSNMLNPDNKGNDTIYEADFDKYKTGKGLAATFGYKGEKINNRNGLEPVLKSGSLYKATVTPGHNHTVIGADGKPYIVPAPLDIKDYPNAAPEYIITDFNILADTKDGLKFDWEYIPGVNYELYYSVVDINAVVNKPNEITKKPVIITAEQAQKLLIEGNRVQYSVSGKEIQPGQIYAACVIPLSVQGGSVNGIPSDAADRVRFNRESPKIIYATPEIPLEINDVGAGKIRLSWEMPSWLQINEANLNGITIWTRRVGADKWEDIATIYKNPYYFDCNKPAEEMEYRVSFDVDKKHMILYTNTVVWSEIDIPTVPFAPQIPEEFPFLEAQGMTSSQIDKLSASDYLTKFDTYRDDAVLNKNTLDQFAKHTFHYVINENDQADVQLVWDATEDGSTGKVNYNLYYDIWVAESKAGLETAKKTMTDLQLTEKDTIKSEDDAVVGFKTMLTGLTPNKTYYIKVVAKSKSGDTKYQSLPTVVSITIKKVGDVFNPPSVGKPPLQIEAIREDEDNKLILKWVEEWYEIASKNYTDYQNAGEQLLAQYGMSRIYLYHEASNPYLRYVESKEEPSLKPYDLYGQPTNVMARLEEIQKRINDVAKDNTYYKDNYIENHVNLGTDTKYEIVVMKEAEADQKRGDTPIEKWVADFTKNESYNWTSIDAGITSSIVAGIDGKAYTISNDYEDKPLESNTTYLVILRTSRVIDGKLQTCVIPSYILGTTLSGHKPDPVIPETPILNLVSTSSQAITVKWEYDSNFEYELKYSRLDNPDEAEVWTFTEEDMKTFVNGQYAYATVNGLLPDETYNLWLRATQKEENLPEGQEPQTTDYSTPVTCKTKPLEPPNPPNGLGLASVQGLKELGKDFPPKGSDYLTIEWSKDPNDILLEDAEGTSHITYGYVVEFADNQEFRDSVVVTTGDEEQTTPPENNDENDTEQPIGYEILSKNMVKFTGLNANTRYYIRVKTVLNYSNEDKKIVLESEFTDWIRLTTNTSNDEYDGGENPNQVIFDKPIEETFINGIWTYKLQDVAKITSDILNNKQYYYKITMKNYNNRYDAKVRRIQMPKIIMDTLIKNGMALKVETNIGVYEIPAHTLKSTMSKYQAQDVVQIDLTRMDMVDILSYNRSYPEQYKKGEQLAISIKGNKVQCFDDLIQVSLKLGLTGAYNFANYNTYQYNYEAATWKKYNYVVDDLDNAYLAYKTDQTGLNALYEKLMANSSEASSYTMNQIASNYEVKGLGNIYFRNDRVGSSQYVALLVGICLDKEAIDLTLGATQADYNKARLSGIYSGNSKYTMTKEQALAGIVRLYEIKQGNKIKPSHVKIKGTSSSYQTAVSKAYAIGLISELNPQDKITYGELCDWLAQVIE